MEIRPSADPDSRARTHLANERTFLAWLRTGLTLIALGVAAAHFLIPGDLASSPMTSLLAIVVVVTGIALVAIGLARYIRGRDLIDQAQFAPAARSIVGAAAFALVAGLLAVGFILSLSGVVGND